MDVFEVVIALLLGGATLAALARSIGAPYPALVALSVEWRSGVARHIGVGAEGACYSTCLHPQTRMHEPVVGYVFDRDLPALEHYVGQASLALVLLAALAALLLLVWRRFGLSGEALWGGTARARAFVVARFTPGQFLGLHLTVGMFVSLLGLLVFGAVTEGVIHNDPLTQFDLALLNTMRGHSTPTGDRVFATVSLMGSPVTMSALALGGATWLAWRRRWLVLAGWASAFIGAALLGRTLKAIIQRPRPAGATAFLHGASSSFPSNHTLGALIGFGMLAYLLVIELADRRRTRIAVIAVTVMLVLAIALSRLYLGVHYFSDVVGGFAAGMLWLSVCISGLEIARRRRALHHSAEPNDTRATNGIR